MRIGIDARLANAPRTGIGSYTAHLVAALARAGAPERFVLFTDAPLDAPAGCETVVVPGRNRHAWTFGRLPAACRRARLDLFHGTANFALPAFAGCPLVATVHDLIPLRFPAAVSRGHRLLFGTLVRRAIRASRRLNSEPVITRREILARFPRAAGKIAVVPYGVDPAFTAAGDAAADRRVRERHGLRGRYLLFVGVFEPRKNVPFLVDAFEILRHTRPEAADLQLALAGGAGWRGEAITAGVRSRGLEPAVRLLGYVPDADLPALYRGATLAVVPSQYEGFGLPALEAMACGAPVLAAEASALPETVGDAGELFAPGNPGLLAARLAELAAAPERLAALRERGLARAAAFSWDRCAAETLAVYREAARVRT
ncbi:MAG TPA: glycosyltransferase family 1 protein [Candidatus Methanoperedens sp.]|nr:glycosyltransferase family 1 protein [Candidatus Methanoperedens sp.]